MSLRRRIMLLVTIGLIVATAPLGVMGIGMLRAATDRILDERLAMARVTAEHLNEEISEGWGELNRLSERVAPLWRNGDLDRVHGVFADVTPRRQLFSGGLFLIDSTGRGIVEATDRSLLPPGALGGLPSVRQTLAEGDPAISEPVRTPAGIPAVVFTVAVPGAPGRPMGAVAGIINLDDSILRVLISSLAVGTSGHAAIVNERGIVLASTDLTEQFTTGEHPGFFARGIAAGRAFVGSAEENHGAPAERAELHIMAFAPLRGAPWGLGVGQNEEETFGPIRRLRDRVIVFGLLVLAAALLFAWLDTGAVVAPIRLLKDVAEGITGGDLRRPVAVRRSDEIGALAASFEQMRSRLLASLEEIRRRAAASQALYEVGAEVLSLQERDAVLGSIAERAFRLLRSDVAVICLQDGPGGSARVGALAGATEAVLPGPRALPLEPGAPASGCLRCPNLEARFQRAHLAAPLVVGGRTVGALCVASQVERTYAPQDREVLHGLANLAAIAVENARLHERIQSMAVAEERERLAREMHDSVGQVLGYVNTKAQAVKALLDAGKTAEAQVQLVELEQAARDVYADLREAILGLRTEISPDRGLIPVLHEYVRRFSGLSGVATELVLDDDAVRYAFGPTTELHLLRIVQEALTNVRRHAAARRAWVRLTEHGGRLMVTVQDDGLGFDPQPVPAGGWPRFGLQTMQERAAAIGGVFTIRRRAGGGTEITVEFPIARERADARPAGG